MTTNPRRLALVLALAWTLPLLAGAQDDPPPLPIPDEPPAPAEPALVPGELPADATAEARELWKALCAATRAEGAETKPVTSFRLTFDLRQHPSETESHDVNGITFAFLAPQGFVRFRLQSNRENLRGPDGDFMKTSEGEAVRLEGREFKEDRRQIDEFVRIAKNFVALTDPARLRIAALRTGVEVPRGLPPRLVTRAAKLRWLEVVSPDFHLARTNPAEAPRARSFRALLGLDPKTNRIELVELHEDGGAPTAPILIRFEEYVALDGFLVPRLLQFYELVPNVRLRTYRETPTSDLVMHKGSGTLAAGLKPEDFLP